MNTKPIAVSFSDYKAFGCVHCGCDYSFNQFMRTGGTIPVKCGECDTDFVILADELEISDIGFGEEQFKPKMQKHPRNGIPAHAYIRPDLKPNTDTNAEFWNPRGIGYDLSGFVKSKEAGARIVTMIKDVIQKEPASWLDYRPSEPNWIQVKIQESDGFDLKKLHSLCKDDGIIDTEKLKQAYRNAEDNQQFAETQIVEYAKKLKKLDLLLFDAITTTEELLNNPISDAIIKGNEPNTALLSKIANIFGKHTQCSAVQEVTPHNTVFADYDCIAEDITRILQKQKSEN